MRRRFGAVVASWFLLAGVANAQCSVADLRLAAGSNLVGCNGYFGGDALGVEAYPVFKGVIERTLSVALPEVSPAVDSRNQGAIGADIGGFSSIVFANSFSGDAVIGVNWGGPTSLGRTAFYRISLGPQTRSSVDVASSLGGAPITHAVLFGSFAPQTEACASPPASPVANNAGAFGLYAGVVPAAATVVSVGHPTTTVINISGERVWGFRGGEVPLPLWLSVHVDADSGVSVQPNGADLLGGSMANVNMVRPDGATSYKVSFCERGSARFKLLFDAKGISFTLATAIVPEFGGADKVGQIIEFLSDLQNEVPLLASALNHFAIAASPQSSGATKRLNIEAGLRDLRELARPGNGNQRAAYVLLLGRYGISTVFGMSVDAFLSARALGLAATLALIGSNLANSVASISLITGLTGDLSLQTPIVIVLDGRR